MNFTFYRPYQIQLHVTRANASIFELRMLFREGGNWQVRDGVYVPGPLQGTFHLNEVVGLHLESLGMRSAASQALPGAPQFVVLGIELQDGRKLQTTPPELYRVRRVRFALAGALALSGALGALTSLAWFGGLAVGIAMHLAHSAMGIRVTPFWPPARQYQ